MLRFISAAALAGAAMLALSSTANAAGEDFCRGYVDAAMAQVRGALSIPRCAAMLPNTPRWSTDRHVHWDWCRSVSREQADAEREGRRIFISHCR